MIFLTVGTQFPFDRLVKSLDAIIAGDGFEEDIFAQIANSSYQPENFKAVSSLAKKDFDRCIRQAFCIIGHAGMGTITAALQYDKPLLVMPRLRKYREVVNDHQMIIARRFEKSKHLLAAYETKQLPLKIKQLKTFTPSKRFTQPQMVAERIKQFLNKLT